MRSTDFERLGDILARQHQIRIHKSGKWAADIKSRSVFYNGPDIYSLEEDQILGLLLHEIAHIHYTTESGPYKDHKELMQSAINLIEDIAIEHIIGGDYPNAKEILDITREEVLTKLIDLLPTLQTPLQEKAMLYGSAKFHGRGFEVGVSDYEVLGEKIAKVLEENKDKILTRKQTSDLVPVAEEIVKLIIQEAGDLNDEEKKQRNAQERNDGKSGTTNTGAMGQIRKKLIESLKNTEAGFEAGSDLPLAGGVEFVDAIGDQAQIVGKQIRATLKRNQAMEFSGRYRTGKLKAKSIKRIIVNKDARPFQRRIIKSNQSYAFAVTSDVSGSMFDDYGVDSTASKAMTGLWMVAEALRLAKVPRALFAFADNPSLLAKMGSAKISWVQVARQDKLEKAGGGTNIGKAMIACINELKQARAERKIMIILTDGGDGSDRVREAYKEAKKEGIECIGIEIGSGALAHVLKDKRSIQLTQAQANKIGEAFIKILKETVKVDRGITL